MAQLIANRTMTIGGRQVMAGQPIPAESLRKMPAGRLKQMTEQRMVSEDSARVSSKKER